MKMTTRGRYAVMALIDLALTGKGRPMALADIAKRQGISLSYLEQLFSRLRKGGLVRSVRGPGGGYLLAWPADETRISDVILAVDEPIRAARLTPDAPMGTGNGTGRCITDDLWDELGNQMHLFLSSITIEDVLERRILGTSRLFDMDALQKTAPRAVEDDNVVSIDRLAAE